MTEPATLHATNRFPSLAALAQRHNELLERLGVMLGEHDEPDVESQTLAKLEPELQQFLAMCAATGVVLDDMGDRTQAQALYDYWATALRRAGFEAPRARLETFNPECLPQLADDACPYVGTEPFRSGEHFFGRESDVEEILARVEHEQIIVICGPAGSGKSSLLAARVVPAITARKQVHVAGPMRPGPHPLERLATTLPKQASQESTLLAIDQFEELFTLTDDTQRSAFDKALVAFLDAKPGNQLLMCVSAELFDRIARLPLLAERLEENDDKERAIHSLLPLDPTALARAISEPAAQLNLELKPGVVKHLIQEVRTCPASLPVLQFMLCEMWAKRDRNRITLEAVETLGDPSQALDLDAERRYAALAAEVDPQAIRRLLLELVRIDDLLDYHRQPVTLARLRELGGLDTSAHLLEKHGLVRIVDAEIVELRHEGLIRHWRRLQNWIKEERRLQRSARKALTDAARRWDSEGQPNDGLFRRLQLAEARKFNGLTKLEQDFLAASDEQLDREHREREHYQRRMIWLSSSAAALFFGLAVIAFVAWRYKGEKDTFANAAVTLIGENADLTGKNADLTGKNADLTGKNADLTGEKGELESAKQKLQTHMLQVGDEQIVEIVNQAEKQEDQPLPLDQRDVNKLRRTQIEIHLASEIQREAVEKLMAQLSDLDFTVNVAPEDALLPERSQIRYRCSADENHAQSIQLLLSEGLEIQVEIPAGLEPGSCEREDQGVIEVWLAPHTLTIWLQVASDGTLAAAQETLRVHGKNHWGTPEVMIIQRRKYHVLMVGPYPTVDAARMAIDTAPEDRYDLGRFIRRLDSFCPVRVPLSGQPILGESLYRCDGLPPLKTAN
jgi:hypothetical protein